MTIQGETNLGGMSDGELAAQVASGNHAALECLLQRHATLVLNATRRVLGNSSDADDAFQAVFMLLASKAGTLTQRDTLADWLHFSAVNISRRALRSAFSRRQREEEVAAMHTGKFDDDASVRSQWSEAKMRLDEELQAMPEHYRTVLILHHLQSHSVEQTAGIMKKPIGTVAGWLSRAREILRDKLTRRGIAIPSVAIASLLSQAATAPACNPELMSQALSAATSVAGGSTFAELVSPRTTALYREELQQMYWNSNSKLAMVAMLALLLCGSAALFAARKSQANGPAASAPPVMARAAEKPILPEPKPNVKTDPAPALAPDDWTELIAQLSENDPEKRVEIEKELRDNFEAAKPALEKATTHDDPEVSARAAKIVAIKKHEPLVQRIKTAQLTAKTLDFEFSMMSSLETSPFEGSGHWKGYVDDSSARVIVRGHRVKVNGQEQNVPHEDNEVRMVYSGQTYWVEFNPAGTRFAMKSIVSSDDNTKTPNEFNLSKVTRDLCEAIEFTQVTENVFQGEPVFVLDGIVSEAKLFGPDAREVERTEGPSVLDELRAMKKARLQVSRNDLIVRKAEAWDAANKLLAMIEIKDLKLNPVFAENEFEYTPPVGMKVFDTSKMTTKDEFNEYAKAMGMNLEVPVPTHTIVPATKE
jgi:RNA polymerase sigma factor (sigma-70 family)